MVITAFLWKITKIIRPLVFKFSHSSCYQSVSQHKMKVNVGSCFCIKVFSKIVNKPADPLLVYDEPKTLFLMFIGHVKLQRNSGGSIIMPIRSWELTLVRRDSVWMFMKTTGTPADWDAVSHAFALARVSSRSL